MATQACPAGGAPSTAPEAAREYLARGWSPVPLVPAAKKPDPSDWPNFEASEGALERDFGSSRGVGLLLGDRSGGLVDVDLDDPFALRLADAFLPATQLETGRKSSPRSHRWFRASGATTRKFADPTKRGGGAMLVELRSSGAQTVVPPSLHPTGESVVWEREGEPAEVDPGELERACAELAAACLMARHWPARGSRHDAVLAWAGAILRRGLDEDKAVALICRAAEAAGDDEWRDRGADVRSTAERLRRGGKATGIPTLEGLGVERTVIDKVLTWLDLPDTRPPRAGRAADTGSPILVRMCDVEPQVVAWLWRPFIPRGKVTLLEGDPGLGKTWLSLAIAAAVSTGGALPGGEARGAAGVLLMTAEDGLGDTLRPRLEALGADLQRVVVLDGVATEIGRREFTLADITPLEEALRGKHSALVVIDPVQGFLGAGVDMHRANEVRPLLAALARTAEAFDCAVLVIRHLRKSRGGGAVHQGLGSIDFAAAVRSILLVAEDPEDPERRVMAHSKSNLAERGGSLAFTLEGGGFTWAGESGLGADELLGLGEKAQPGALEAAEEWLQERLADGPVPSTELEREAEELGVSWRTVQRAKAKLGIHAERLNFEGGWWVWTFEQPATKGAKSVR